MLTQKKSCVFKAAFSRSACDMERLESRLLLAGIAPNATIDSPLDGAEISVGGSVNLQGTATDPDGTIASHAWFILGPGPGSGGLPIFIANYETADPGSITLPNAGYYTIIYAVTDNDGNTDSTPAQVSVKVGSPTNVPPNGTITSPIDGTVINPGGKVNLASSATDSDGAVIMHVWTGFGPGGFAANPQEDPTYLMQNPGDVQLDAPGEYFFAYVPIDNSFQPDPSPAFVKVRVNTPPESVINSPLDGAFVAADTAINLQGTATDDTGISAYNWQVTGPGGFSRTFTSEDPGNLVLTTPGAYTVTFRATDADGAVDPTPATAHVTVYEPGAIQLVGKVTTAQGQQVYIYDTDALGPGMSDINGVYDNTYNPNSLANDLQIVGTPGGVVVIARGQILVGSTIQKADHTGLGIVVPNGKISAFIDQRTGNPSAVSFIAAQSGIATAIFNSEVTGLPPGSDLIIAEAGGFTVPQFAGIFTDTGSIGTAIINGTDNSSNSLLGNVLSEGLSTLITIGHAPGNIRIDGKVGNVMVGLGGPIAGNLGGEVSGQSIAMVYTTGNMTGSAIINSQSTIGMVYSAKTISAGITAASDIRQVFAKESLNGSVDAGGALGQAFAQLDITAELSANREMQLVYAGRNFTGGIDTERDLQLFYAKGSVTSLGSIDVTGAIQTMVVGSGLNANIAAASANLIAVQGGNFSGSLDLTGGAGTILVASGNLAANVNAGGTLTSVTVSKGAVTGKITANKIGTLLAAATRKEGANRATIIADEGITNLFVMGNMTDTDVGVGTRSLAAGKRVELGFLYVAGDVERTNVLVGVWNEHGPTASPFDTFSDGGENGAPYIPAGFDGSATLRQVFVKGTVGDGSGIAGQWAIASRNKGSIWTVKSPAADYIIDPDVFA
ncbi:MAG TPA: Ig-like domain-containing protein [Candidatus Brocadiia bacterium]|nr:Ig-like domain-containing protein [Candidatus Brocadiia bacterium]